MTKPKAFKKELRKAGCVFVGEGGKHEKWRTDDGEIFMLPRGKISNGLAHKIRKIAGIK